ncbi:MAG: type I restriction-modification system specificity subunit, partial [uncultured bacterium]
MSWPEVELIDAVEFIRNGASIKQTDGAKGLPITRIETIWNSEIDSNRFGYADIFEESLGGYADYLLNPGDLLISHINSLKHLGKTAIYKGLPAKVIHGMNLLSLRPKKDFLDSSYAYFYFNSGFFKAYVTRIANQSVNQASFSAGNLKSIKIPLPPLPIQKKIAAVLEKADELRRKREEQIKRLDDLLQATFLDMFGD